MDAFPRKNRGPSAGPDNRRALIAAAREVFATDGFAAPFSSIAKRAGVGQGSLYRHFPDRVSLAVAIFQENIDELGAIADRPGSTLDDLLAAIVEQALVSDALIELTMADQDDERVTPLGDRIAGILETVVDRERSAGRIRADVATADVELAIGMLAGVLARTPESRRRATARRAWTLLHAAFAP